MAHRGDAPAHAPAHRFGAFARESAASSAAPLPPAGAAPPPSPPRHSWLDEARASAGAVGSAGAPPIDAGPPRTLAGQGGPAVGSEAGSGVALSGARLMKHELTGALSRAARPGGRANGNGGAANGHGLIGGEGRMPPRAGAGDASSESPGTALRKAVLTPPLRVSDSASTPAGVTAGGTTTATTTTLTALSAECDGLTEQLDMTYAVLEAAASALRSESDSASTPRSAVVAPPRLTGSLLPSASPPASTRGGSGSVLSLASLGAPPGAVVDTDLRRRLEQVMEATRAEETRRGGDDPRLKRIMELRAELASVTQQTLAAEHSTAQAVAEADALREHADTANARIHVLASELARAQRAAASMPSGDLAGGSGGRHLHRTSSGLSRGSGSASVLNGKAVDDALGSGGGAGSEERDGEVEELALPGGPEHLHEWGGIDAEVVMVMDTVGSAVTLPPLPVRTVHDDTGRKKSRLERLITTAPKSNFTRLAEIPTELRKACQVLIEWVWFERLILFLIIANTLLLAFDSPLLDPKSDLAAVLRDCDVAFTVAFTLEMVIKINAMGFVEEQTAYLRDPWNWLDFIIVLTGLVALFGDNNASGTNFSSLRSFRVLRPLRTITHLVGLRVLVNALLRSIPLLMNTLVVCAFYFLVFGIIGVQLWAGLFKSRCFFTDTGLLNEADERVCGGQHVCGDGQFCGKWIQNPNSGVTSFDNILWAFNTIFQCITLEGWVDVMYWAQDSYSAWTWIYFVMLILFGAFILINLTLAVIMTKFRDAQEEQERRDREEQEEAERREKKKEEAIQRAQTRREMMIENKQLLQAAAAAKNVRKFSGQGRLRAKRASIAAVARLQAELDNKARKSLYQKRLQRIVQGASKEGSGEPIPDEKAEKVAAAAAKVLLNMREGVRKKRLHAIAGLSRSGSPLAGAGVAGGGGGGAASGSGVGDDKDRDLGERKPSKDDALSRSTSHKTRAHKGVDKEAADAAARRAKIDLLPELAGRASAGPPTLSRVGSAGSGGSGAQTPLDDDTHSVDSVGGRGGRGGRGSSRSPAPFSRDNPTMRGSSGADKGALSSPSSRKPSNLSRLSLRGADDDDGEGGAGAGGESKLVRRLSAITSSPHVRRVLQPSAKVEPKWKQRYSKSWNTAQFEQYMDPPEDLPMHQKWLWRAKVRARRAQMAMHRRIAHVRDACAIIVETPLFRGIVTLTIVANTVVLAIDHHGMSVPLKESLAVWNILFAWVFILEMMFKVFGLGAKGYCADWFNIFDGVIVLLSILEMALDSGGSGTFTAFRIVRIFRVIKLVRYLESMQQIIRVVSNSLGSFSYIALLLVIFSFIYSVLGIQLFGGKFNFEDGVPRNNFDSLHWAFITVFQILSGEGWNEVMYLGVAAGGPAATLFYISWVIIGQFILLNLFLAVLLDGFGVDDEEEEDDDDANKGHNDGGIRHRVSSGGSDSGSGKGKDDRGAAASAGGGDGEESASVGDGGGNVSVKHVRSRKNTMSSGDDDDSRSRVSSSRSRRSKKHRNRSFLARLQDVLGLGSDEEDDSSSDDEAAVNTPRAIVDDEEKQREADRKKPRAQLVKEVMAWTDGPPPEMETWRDRHMYLVSPHSALSQWMRRISSTRLPLLDFDAFGQRRQLFFDYIILAMIAVSSVALALETPGSEQHPTLATMELFFTVLFTIEVVIKVLANGFVMHNSAYLRNGYNVIDFIVVLSAIANQIMKDQDIGFVRTLRLVRCLRPLRVISRNRGMKMVVNALFNSVGGILNVIFVLLLVWLMFAILGVQIFGGKLHKCTDPDFPPNTPRNGTDTVAPCDGYYVDKETGQELPREWVSSQPNFDNVFNGMLMLFIMSSGEGWPDVMFACSDVTGVDVSPMRDYSWYNAYYFVVFVCIGGFFLMNLFIGVVFDNFMRLKKNMESFGFLTPEQREWVRTQRKLASSKAMRHLSCPSTNKVRRFVFNIVVRPSFEAVVMLLIAINVGFLAAQFDDMAAAWAATLEEANFVFTIIFAVEVVLKVTGLGWRQYISDPWNKFDLTVVLGSILDIAFSFLSTSFFRVFRVGRAVARVFRILRVTRVLRLAKSVAGLRRLVLTLWASLPSLVNVGSLLLLLFFIYAVIGVFIFGQVELGEDLNVHANFSGFAVALVTLFRISTGEGWEGIMFDAMNQPGGWNWAPLYFVSFVTIAMFIMLNLFIMIIVEDFDEMESGAKSSGMQPYQLVDFQFTWSQYDPQGTNFISESDVEHFLRSLPEPMGVGKRMPRTEFLHLIAQLQVKSWFGRVHYREMLLAIHRRTFGDIVPVDVVANVEKKEVGKLNRTLSRKFTKRDQRRGGTLNIPRVIPMGHVMASKAINEVLGPKLRARAKALREHRARRKSLTGRRHGSAPELVGSNKSQLPPVQPLPLGKLQGSHAAGGAWARAHGVASANSEVEAKANPLASTLASGAAASAATAAATTSSIDAVAKPPPVLMAAPAAPLPATPDRLSKAHTDLHTLRLKPLTDADHPDHPEHEPAASPRLAAMDEAAERWSDDEDMQVDVREVHDIDDLSGPAPPSAGARAAGAGADSEVRASPPEEPPPPLPESDEGDDDASDGGPRPPTSTPPPPPPPLDDDRAEAHLQAPGQAPAAADSDAPDASDEDYADAAPRTASPLPTRSPPASPPVPAALSDHSSDEPPSGAGAAPAVSGDDSADADEEEGGDDGDGDGGDAHGAGDAHAGAADADDGVDIGPLSFTVFSVTHGKKLPGTPATPSPAAARNGHARSDARSGGAASDVAVTPVSARGSARGSSRALSGGASARFVRRLDLADMRE